MSKFSIQSPGVTLLLTLASDFVARAGYPFARVIISKVNNQTELWIDGLTRYNDQNGTHLIHPETLPFPKEAEFVDEFVWQITIPTARLSAHHRLTMEESLLV